MKDLAELVFEILDQKDFPARHAIKIKGLDRDPSSFLGGPIEQMKFLRRLAACALSPGEKLELSLVISCIKDICESELLPRQVIARKDEAERLLTQCKDALAELQRC